MMAERLLTILEFAAAVQPLVAPINAFNWLGDMRRVRKSYLKRTTHRPVWLKIGGIVYYPESELAKTIAGIKAYEAAHGAPPARSPKPSAALTR